MNLTKFHSLLVRQVTIPQKRFQGPVRVFVSWCYNLFLISKVILCLFFSNISLPLYLKAIHNKDYSVVKTLKAVSSGIVFLFYTSSHQHPHALTGACRFIYNKTNGK